MKTFGRSSVVVLGIAFAAGIGCSLVIADYPDSKLNQGQPGVDSSVPGVDGGDDVSPTDGGTDGGGTDTFVAWTARPCSTGVTPPVPPVGSLGPLIRYPADLTLSPITPYITSNILAIAKKHPGRAGNVFIKVGDSNTVNGNFLTCFTAKPPYTTMSESEYVNLDKYATLDRTIDYFAACVATTTPFERVSLAAAGGTGTSYPLTGGTPNFLDQEVTALNPQFAVVMYGTNDIGNAVTGGDYTVPGSYASHFGPQGYPGAMLTLIDALIERGIVPMLTTIPPKTTTPEIKMFVSTFNAVVRGVAEARQVPLIDWNRELQSLKDFGLGADGTHPIFLDAESCNFKPDNLSKYGFNIRNLITLQTLERMRQVFVEKVANIDLPAKDARTITLAGAGTAASPWAMDALPFTDVHDFFAAGTTGSIADYPGCSGAPSQPGNEQVYKLVLSAKTPVRIFVSPKNTALPLRVNMMSAASGASCVSSDKALIAKTLDAGTYYFSVDSEATTETTNGEYMFGVVKCDDGDTSCN